MNLKIGNVEIKEINFADVTKVENNKLLIQPQEIKDYLLTDQRLESIRIELVRPGDKTRIIPVKDVIEPRVKLEGPGEVFPGVISKVDTVGEGFTKVLKGVAVVTTGQIVGFQEGIIDMSGPGAEYTPFSQTLNIVISANVKKGLSAHAHEEALRIMGLKAATLLGAKAKDVDADEIINYETLPLPQNIERYQHLPKVAYVYMLQSQGLLHDTYFYGVDVKNILPTFIYPTEVMDGAIVSGNCVSACDKNTTYHHQNNPVILDLMHKHGQELCFLGCVITNENVTLMDKERSSSLTAKLVEFIGAEGAIVSEEGFGNPDTDLMMNCQKLEDKMIKTVLLTDEYAGRDGASQSLADATTKADAVVTCGNANMTITLPAMEKVIGDQEHANVIAGGFETSLKEDGSIMVEIQAITGATNELGFNKMTAITK